MWLLRYFVPRGTESVYIDIIIAGLSTNEFDELKKESEKRIAPSGELFVSPVRKPGYPKEAAAKYQEQCRDRMLALPENTRVSLTLAYVDYGEETTRRFVEAFRPFALVRPIRRSEEFGKLRAYREYLVKEAKELRDRATRISEFTNIANVTPFLLPYRNFASRHHREIVDQLFLTLGTVDDIRQTMEAAKNDFHQHHARQKPPQGQQGCYSDGRLYFRSPGKARHGYFRHTLGQGHDPACLLAARCRYGGTYAHDLHYDCEPVDKLEPSYPNCHGAQTPPGWSHVNICPNDFVI